MRWLMTVLFSQEFSFWEFTIHCRGSEGSLAHLLYSILLFYFSYILVQFLLYPSLKLSLFFFFLFILSSSFPIIPNILCQISCYPIHRVFLLYICLAILLSYLPWCTFSLLAQLFCCILFQIDLLTPIHFLSFLLAPRCLPLLYILSITLNIYSFLWTSFYSTLYSSSLSQMVTY